MKKATLSLQYIFLLFMGVIIVFVIVGMVTTWATSSNKFVKNMFTDDDDSVPENQLITIEDCDFAPNEIVKHAKLCFVKGMQGEIRGEFCYGLIKPDGCTSPTKSDLNSSLTLEEINFTLEKYSEEKLNVLISYDYFSNRVEVS